MKIFKYPNKYLTAETGEVDILEWNDTDLPSLVETMKYIVNSDPNAVALAANQVGLPWRLFVVRKSFAENFRVPELLINPKIAASSVTKTEEIEGCLSFPGFSLPIKRYDSIVCRHTDLDGSEKSISLEGFPARVFQHEIEHLEGKTFLDNVDRMTKFRIIEKMRKI